MQLQLKPALHRTWRAPDTVQIGLSPDHGTQVEGLTEEDARLLDELRDGVDAAALVGGQQSRQRELIGLLTEAGVLLRRRAGRAARARLGLAATRWAADAEVWSVVRPGSGDGWDVVAARRLRHVAVRGAGRLGTTLAATLASAGVGHVTVEDGVRVAETDLAAAGAGLQDVGRSRAEVAADAVVRAGGQPYPPGPGPAARPDVVVLIDHGAADARRADALIGADIAHLSVVVREDDALVGPLVRPGRGPCLRCLDLHRGDRDPAWPSLLAQVLTPGAGPGELEETGLVTIAAGLATLQLVAFLDGVETPAAAGATLEVELPDGLVARREWPAHPRCGCHWPPGATPGTLLWSASGVGPRAGPSVGPPGDAHGHQGEWEP